MPNSCSDGAYIGDDVLIEVSLVCAETPPGSYLTVGGSRGLSLSGEWGTTDVTSRTSTSKARETLATYLEYSGSTDGTVLKASAQNIKTIRKYVLDAATGQPKGWVRYTIPDASGATETIEIPVVFNSFSTDAPYDDVVTFELAWTGDGAAVFTDVPA